MENKGFTLIEVLVVIAIIGILVGIALPSYQAHVRKANRIDAKMAITKISLIAERKYARQGSYPADTTEAVVGVDIPTSYSITFTRTLDAKGFDILAEPQGAQANDECGDLTLDETGTPGADLTTGCW